MGDKRMMALKRYEMDLKTMKDTPPWDWPENAGTILLETLRDDQSDEPNRLLAAELAGDSTVINGELADCLLSIVRNGEEPEHLRAKAVISLGPALQLADEGGYEGDPEEPPFAEDTFRKIQDSLRKLSMDTGVPKEVKRRILEASVRAPQDWHQGAIRSAYSSDDEDWKLTAVFCMRWVSGFDDEILEALESRNPDIHYQAVCAAGSWEVDAAWPHVAALVTSKDTGKPLLLAAIDAIAGIRPQEAAEILAGLTGADDDEIAEAASEALAMAEGLANNDFDDEDGKLLH
jgi:hypothetical protein